MKIDAILNNDDVNKLVGQIKSGEVKGLIISGLNPVYSLPNGSEFRDLIRSLKFSLVFSSKFILGTQLKHLIFSIGLIVISQTIKKKNKSK